MVHPGQSFQGRLLSVTPERNTTHQLEGVAGVVPDVGADDLADHRVLAHQHGGGAAERETNLSHLAGPHIVSLQEGERESKTTRPTGSITNTLLLVRIILWKLLGKNGRRRKRRSCYIYKEPVQHGRAPYCSADERRLANVTRIHLS